VPKQHRGGVLEKPPEFKVVAYAKLNLSLLVFHPNKKGYHPICSVFQEISLHDQLTIQVIPEKTCLFQSNSPHFPTDQTNLLYQVYNKFKHHLSHGLHITVNKKIPMGSGLGGGSSNAAALITFINTFFKLNTSSIYQRSIAKSLGADIPFFLTGGTQLVRGIGEKCTPLPTKKNQYYVLIMPQIHSNTKSVFKHYDQQKELKFPIKTPKSILENYMGPNDLKDTVYHLNPIIKRLENVLHQLNTPPIQLSGTGSTLFFTVSSWSHAIKWEKNLTTILDNCIVKAVKPISSSCTTTIKHVKNMDT